MMGAIVLLDARSWESDMYTPYLFSNDDEEEEEEEEEGNVVVVVMLVVFVPFHAVIPPPQFRRDRVEALMNSVPNP